MTGGPIIIIVMREVRSVEAQVRERLGWVVVDVAT
jgi:hypothetical protein